MQVQLLTGVPEWALQEDWVLGVRASSTGKLVAFITGVPATVRCLHSKQVRMQQQELLGV